MSTKSQLGLFSSFDAGEGAPSADAATPAAAASPEPATAVSVAVCRKKVNATSRISRADLRNRDEALFRVTSQADERYLSVQDVARRFGVSAQTVWRHTKHNPAFPKPIKILDGTTRWRMSEVMAFEVSRQEASR